MNEQDIRLDAIFDEIREQSCVADNFLDRERYQLLVCTVWSNLVMNPDEAGIDESQLESIHDLILEEIRTDLGADADLASCFKFLTTKSGEAAMQANKLSGTHKDLLLYFSSMILDPEGHKRWSDDLREQQKD